MQRCKAQIVDEYSELTYRIWLLYGGSAAAFHRGEIAVYQTLMRRPDGGETRLPLNHNDWYAPEGIQSASDNTGHPGIVTPPMES